MHTEAATSPALVIALAMAAGIICQILARHLRVPGIVLLLVAGVVLGPEVLGIVDPSALGHGMHDIVGFAVAVILFEGGLNLNVRRLRREAVPLQRLLTVGALITLTGASLAARGFLRWDWSLAVLFGSLVIVTGPTVITPLLRRIRVHRTLETILEAEGVFIDAIGAIVAIVALEVVVQGPSRESVTQGLMGPPLRLGAGTLLGLAGGALLSLLLRVRNLVPEGLQNTFSLAWALALFQVSNLLVPETGIAAVIVAGLVVGNTTAAPPLRELREFKEQLTVLLIGLLFVLLAADVELDDILSLGTGGVLVVVVLMLVVRPLSVAASTVGSELDGRQRAFLAWVAPRGIVAAAIATLFADRLDTEAMAGGDALRAMVFLVIGGTVVLQGATASFMARLLGLRRPSDRGYAILGANPLARLLARLLKTANEDVVIMDANRDSTREAQEEGLRVVFGNALEERAMLSAQFESRRGIVGLLTNSAQNLLFAGEGRDEGGAPRAWAAIQRGPGAVDPETITDTGTHVLFAGPQDLELWSVRVRRKLTEIETWERQEDGDPTWLPPKENRNHLLPLLLYRKDRVHLIDERSRPVTGDRVAWLVLQEAAESAHQFLVDGGWQPMTEPLPDAEAEEPAP